MRRDTYNKKIAEGFTSNYRTLHIIACSYTKDSSLANDLLQDLVFKILKNKSIALEVLEDEKALLRILKTSVRRMGIDYFRKASKRREDTEQHHEYVLSNSPTIHLPQVMKDENPIRKQLLELTSQEEIQLLEMKYVDEMKAKEIGVLLNITENAVNLRINRAKKKIKDTFNNSFCS